MTSKNYANLIKASINFQYLKTNATTHDFLFGALAELVDNSRDANARNLHIYTEDWSHLNPPPRGNFSLNFLDDGVGMDPSEILDVIQFGKSNKKLGPDNQNLIGQYGNGLKSASMRIGNDMILFTKKNNILSVICLAQTFLETEQITEIIVPMPSFNTNKTPFYREDPGVDLQLLKQRHKTELDIIYRHSPFKTIEDIYDQFDKIQDDQGTLVIVYNLRLRTDGQTELDIITDPNDIQMTDFRVLLDDPTAQLEHKSLRAYVSILYLDPKMKIYIQNKKVRTKLFDRTLYLPRQYSFTSAKFKKKAQDAAEKAEHELKLIEASLAEAESKHTHFSNTKSVAELGSEFHKELCRLRKAKDELKEKKQEKKYEVERKRKFVDQPKNLEFIFGLNINNRCGDGLFLYNCNRLIKMFEHTKLHKSKDNRGIVGIVNIPYLILEPAHNKQHFQDSHEQKLLISTLTEYMEQYIKDLGRELNLDFWKKFGYDRDYSELPADGERNQFLQNRMQYTNVYFQCNQCLQWRKQLYKKDFLDVENVPSDTWNCENSSDPSIMSCNIKQSLEDYQKGELIKEKKVQPSTSASQSSSLNISRQSYNNSFASKPPITYSSEANKVTANKQMFESMFQKNVALNESTNSTRPSNSSGARKEIAAKKQERSNSKRRTGLNDNSDDDGPIDDRRLDPNFRPYMNQIDKKKRPNGVNESAVIELDVDGMDTGLKEEHFSQTAGTTFNSSNGGISEIEMDSRDCCQRKLLAEKARVIGLLRNCVDKVSCDQIIEVIYPNENE